MSNKAWILTDYGGKSIELDLTTGGGGQLSFATVKKQVTKLYTPVEIHFHSPSEHTFNGRKRDVELHIVHTRVYTPDIDTNIVPRSASNATTVDGSHTDQLAVLAIFFDLDEGGNLTNAFIDSLNLTKLATTISPTGLKINTTNNVDLTLLVRNLSKSNFYFYEGSLTTPPC